MSNHDNFQMPNNLNSSYFNYSSNIFNSNDVFNSSNVFNSNDVFGSNNSSSTPKETGIIEKMLSSYGFIQCCERQARLFFHFSQYLGTIDHLKIGDPVEYEMSYDRRTGKPVAINIRKITSENIDTKLEKTERVLGNICDIGQDKGLRVAYESAGEVFFFQFNKDETPFEVKQKDKVSFVIVSDGSGSYMAADLLLEQSDPATVQGIITQIKDSYGFIERSDQESNIFFHSSECFNFKSLQIGDYVEFNISNRKEKMLAVNVKKIPGSFEETSSVIHKGIVQRYNSRANLPSGVILSPELSKEFIFYEKDFNGNFTLYANDIVSFHICTDQRSNIQRACKIKFLEETFDKSNEYRERGYIANMKETYGFIKAPSKEGIQIYFKLSELLDPSVQLNPNDEVSFTFITDSQSGKSQAIRIASIPNGTVFKMFTKPSLHMNGNSQHRVEQSPQLHQQQHQQNDDENGREDSILRMNGHHEKKSVNSPYKKIQNSLQEFQNGESLDSTKTGFIVTVKETYAFVESLDGEHEFFAHQSQYQDQSLQFGDHVVFDSAQFKGQWKALNVRKVEKVTVYEGNLSETFYGVVLRSMRMYSDNEQQDYCGLIARVDQFKNPTSEAANGESFEFSFISVKYEKDFIVAGCFVKFQVGTNPYTNKLRAYNVEVVREKQKGSILSLYENNDYGFIKMFLNGESSKIFFHRSEIVGNSRIKAHDEVQFYLIKNPKSERSYATNVEKIHDSTSNDINNSNNINGTESLFKNLKLTQGITGPRVIVIRQPRAPDGTRGFKKNFTSNQVTDAN